MQAISSGIQPKNRIGAVDGGSRECFPAGIDVFLDLSAAVGYGLDTTAYSNGVSISAS